MRTGIFLAVMVLLFCTPRIQAAQITLARDGQALQDIVTAPNADNRTRAAAKNLAKMLERMTGATFSVKVGDGASGIAVGTAEDFVGLDYVPRFGALTLESEQSYFIRTHERGLHLIGASTQAVEFAVWDFLHRLGYRSYFPSALWEIVPSMPTLTVPSIDDYQSPDYAGRTFWPGGGLWKESTELKDLERWFVRNRMNDARRPRISFGHMYGQIIRDRRGDFEEHRQYLALVEGKREFRDKKASQKFCISNLGLQKLVVDWAIAQFVKHPDRISLSLDPSDGADWCECKNCLAMGTPSDRALYLANIVSDAINHDAPTTRYVTLYAYNKHSPPPNIQVGKNIIVGVATWFIAKGYTVDQIIKGWSAKGAIISIRDYYHVSSWSRDMPAEGSIGSKRFFRARGGDLGYLGETIPDFFRKGARFSHASAGMNWISNGLGYYFVSRVLWDVDEAVNVDDILDQFVSDCFKGAEKPMADYFRLLFMRNHSRLLYVRQPLAFDDAFLAEFNGLVVDAWKREIDPVVRKRIESCVLYNHYVGLVKTYLESPTGARQTPFKKLIKFTYRTKDLQIVSSLAFYRDAHKRDVYVRIPKHADWSVPEDKNPWKSSAPFSDAEIARIIRKLEGK